MKLSKNTKVTITLAIIIGLLLGLIFDEGLDIVITIMCIIIIHKYIYNCEKTDKIFNQEMVFIDKEKYYKGLKIGVIVIDIYLIIKLIIIIKTEVFGLIGMDIILLSQLLAIYASNLAKKYVKTINGEEVNKSVNFINNKTLTIIVLVVFLGFSFNYFSKINISENEISTPSYMWKVDNEKEPKVVEIKVKDNLYQRADYSKGNSKYLEKYSKDAKIITILNVVKGYSMMSTIFMFILCFTQINFKDRKITSKIVDVFLIAAILFAMVALSDTIHLETNLTNYYVTYIEGK